jgi:carbon storage regulator
MPYRVGHTEEITKRPGYAGPSVRLDRVEGVGEETQKGTEVRMLLLSRKRDERIVIGENIVITIVSILGRTVRVGIEAPPDVSVHREEVFRKIKRGDSRDPKKDTKTKNNRI